MTTNPNGDPFQAYRDATAGLDALIEATPTPRDSSRQAVQERAAFRMGRLRRFLERLGNPHLGYPIVHIGGTSGKGSTATALTAILNDAGYRTGLHTSPYLQASTEKLQVNGQLIDPEHYAALVSGILAEHDRWQADGEDSLTYGEVWIALTMLFFQASAVEVAVLEVGAGGRFDLTNIVSPVLSVITSVGIDHTNTLGHTIAEIAWHKAGIIKPGIPIVTAATNPEALGIIRETAREQGSAITVVDPRIWTRDVATDWRGTSWTDERTGERWHTGQSGSFQAINGATALAAVEALRANGFEIPDDAVRTGLEGSRIPGRAELIAGEPRVMLDGAHNADKVAAIAADLATLLPVAPDGIRVAVLGVLGAKLATEMVRSLVSSMDVLVATSPQVMAKEARETAAVVELAREVGFTGPVVEESEPAEAIERAIALATEAPGGAVFVTGSLYLVGNVRERWYQEREIVLQRTPWPCASYS